MHVLELNCIGLCLRVVLFFIVLPSGSFFSPDGLDIQSWWSGFTSHRFTQRGASVNEHVLPHVLKTTPWKMRTRSCELRVPRNACPQAVPPAVVDHNRASAAAFANMCRVSRSSLPFLPPKHRRRCVASAQPRNPCRESCTQPSQPIRFPKLRRRKPATARCAALASQAAL